MQKIKIIFWFAVFFITIGITAFLTTRNYIIEGGTITVTVKYKVKQSEDLTLYWNTGKGFSTKIFKTLITNPNHLIYTYKIKQVDSLLELRLDPAEHFHLSNLYEIKIDGLFEPILLSDFSSFTKNGLQLLKGKESTLLVQEKNNTDPYIQIKIPQENSKVNKTLLTSDYIWLSLSIIFSLILTLFIKNKLLNILCNQSSFSLLYLVSFFFIISASWLNSFLNFYSPPSNIENRVLAQKPNLDSINYGLKKYTTNYTSWYTDNFYYKSMFVHLNSAFKIYSFKTSPMPKSMFIGKQFEFFTSNELLWDDVTGKRRLTSEEIDYMYGNTLAKSTLLKNQNISYYLTIPPSKQTTYNDLLPNYLSLQLKGKKMATQIADRFKKENSDFYIDVLDLINGRRKTHPHERLFYQYDIHWNEWAAFLAYQKLIKEIHQNHPFIEKPLSINEVTLDTSYDNQADLAKLILMNNTFLKQRILITPKKKDSLIAKSIHVNKLQFPIDIFKNPKAKGKLLMFRDSYSEQWKTLIARHFNEAVFVWDQNITQALIDEYKPDIIIQENCEMFLFYLFNPNQINETK